VRATRDVAAGSRPRVAFDAAAFVPYFKIFPCASELRAHAARNMPPLPRLLSGTPDKRRLSMQRPAVPVYRLRRLPHDVAGYDACATSFFDAHV